MAEKENLSATRQPLDSPQTQDVATIPLVEEHVKVTKREVETARVRVHVQVDERREVVTEQLSRDDIEIERFPRNVPVSEMPNVRLEGNTTIIPVVEEVLVVEKRLMLVEEIHIRRKNESEQREIPVTLRREKARVERENVRLTDLDKSEAKS